MQRAFIKETTLVHYNPRRQLWIELDASKQRGFSIMVYHITGDPTSIDKVNRQSMEPILFLSKLLTNAKRRY